MQDKELIDILNELDLNGADYAGGTDKANPGKPGLKAPQPEGGKRRDSFCARMEGMKKKLTS